MVVASPATRGRNTLLPEPASKTSTVEPRLQQPSAAESPAIRAEVQPTATMPDDLRVERASRGEVQHLDARVGRSFDLRLNREALAVPAYGHLPDGARRRAFADDGTRRARPRPSPARWRPPVTSVRPSGKNATRWRARRVARGQRARPAGPCADRRAPPTRRPGVAMSVDCRVDHDAWAGGTTHVRGVPVEGAPRRRAPERSNAATLPSRTPTAQSARG